MRVGIALGSNLDERLTLLRSARAHLQNLHEDCGPFLCSRIYETEPFDCPPGSPLFLNAVIEICCTLPPLDLLHRLQRIEELMGRPSGHAHHAPRTIDLDILYYDNLHFTLPELTLPHPRIHERPFVLCPLGDIRPDLILPGRDQTIAALVSAWSPDDIPRVAGHF
jgi:2-amino-4-hydroxy-6-hydroxymethyldihydropteridine diphosphokinase